MEAITENSIFATTINASTRLLEEDIDECTEEVKQFLPTLAELIEITGPAGIVTIILASICLVIILVLFADTLYHVLTKCHNRHKTHTAIVLTVYPALGTCALLGLLFQRANTFLDSAAKLWFAVCMWQFFSLTLCYFGGETNMIRKIGPVPLKWKNPPCCCWPCCLCFPKTQVNKKQVRLIKCLVAQHPLIQSFLFIIQITLWIEEKYNHGNFTGFDAFPYITLISTVSFCFALHAFLVGFKSSIAQLEEFHYKQKIISFQLCLVFLRMQSLIVNGILVPSGAIPCLPPISQFVFANMLLNSLLLGQLVILVTIARFAYKLQTPEKVTFDEETNQLNESESFDEKIDQKAPIKALEDV